MHLKDRLGRELLPPLLMLAGAGAVVCAATADLVGIGIEGFDAGQILLAAAGLALLLAGAFLATPPGRRTAHRWRERIAADRTPASLLLVAVWFGLLAGWGEALFQFVCRFYLRKVIFLGPDAFWLGPLADLTLLAGFGLASTLIHRRWPRPAARGVWIAVFAFIGYFSLLLLIDELHKLAAVLLALGLAVQTARMATKHAGVFDRLVRYSIGWPIFLVGIRRGGARRQADAAPDPGAGLTRREFLLGAGAGIAVAAIGVTAGRRLREQIAVSALPPVTKSPNVLLIVMDTVRAQSLGFHGYERPTSPSFDRLAQRGVCFRHAVSTCSWTLPSHASMFTGRFPHELSTDWAAPLDGTYPTLAEILGAHGYATAGFAANTLYCSDEFGLARGFAHYEDYRVSAGQAVLSTSLGRAARTDLHLGRVLDRGDNFGRKNAERVNRDFLRWVSKRSDGRPFFAFLNYFDAHDPYLPPKDFALRFSPVRPRGHLTPELRDTLPGPIIKELNDAYDGAVAYVDHHLGLLLDELETAGTLKDTLVVIVSDHGEQFGEHGLTEHANSLYMSVLHVPLVILTPSGSPRGLVVEDWVSLRDLPATVLGMTIGSGHPIPGQSLARFWDAAAKAPGGGEQPLLAEMVLGECARAGMACGPMESLVSGGLHYIRNADGREELYDLQADPWETVNLVDTDVGRRTVSGLRMSLERMLASARGAGQGVTR